MNENVKVIHDQIVAFQTGLDPDYVISLINEVEKAGYFLDQPGRPQETLYLPIVSRDLEIKTNKLRAVLQNSMLPVIFKYNELFNLGNDFVLRPNFVVSRLNPGKDMYTHQDDYDGYKSIEAIYYINEDYDGGEILFDDLKIKYKPKAGEMICFPASILHSVPTVYKKDRYNVVIGYRHMDSLEYRYHEIKDV